MKTYVTVMMICMMVVGAAVAVRADARAPAVLADHPVAMDDDGADEAEDAAPSRPVRVVRATGQHQCQSRESIGHSCRVWTQRAVDCNDAFASLKSDDCCGRTEGGGNSIGFKLLSCSSF